MQTEQNLADKAASASAELTAAYAAVEMVNVCELMDKLSPGWSKPAYRYNEAVEAAKVIAWCKENDAHYYARSRDDFFEHEGVLEAYRAGKRAVVLEDLS